MQGTEPGLAARAERHIAAGENPPRDSDKGFLIETVASLGAPREGGHRAWDVGPGHARPGPDDRPGREQGPDAGLGVIRDQAAEEGASGVAPPPSSSSRTGPYVFLRFEVIVPAPRLAQWLITECPTKPS